MGTHRAPALIRNTMARRGLNYLDLAKASGVNYKRVLREVKHETRELAFDDAIRFAEALGLTVVELADARDFEAAA